VNWQFKGLSETMRAGSAHHPHDGCDLRHKMAPSRAPRRGRRAVPTAAINSMKLAGPASRASTTLEKELWPITGGSGMTNSKGRFLPIGLGAVEARLRTGPRAEQRGVDRHRLNPDAMTMSLSAWKRVASAQSI